MNQVVDDLRGVREVLVEHHLGQIDLGRIARDRLDALDRHLRAAKTAVACVEFLIAIGILVRLGPVAALAVIHGRGGDVHPLPDAFGDASNLAAAGVPVRRQKADIGEKDVAGQIAALEQKSGGNPALAAGPARHGRRRE